jgi:hypothetical protein
VAMAILPPILPLILIFLQRVEDVARLRYRNILQDKGS